jgi:hypothetical protein
MNPNGRKTMKKAKEDKEQNGKIEKRNNLNV